MCQRCRLAALLVLSVALLLTGCTPKQASGDTSPKSLSKQEKLMIGGSGSNLTVTHKLADAFAPQSTHPIELPASLGSGGGIRGTLNDSLDLGLISRPLTDDEKGYGLIEVPYARSGIAVAVHPSVPDDNLTAEDVLAIYQGKKVCWSNGATIVPMLMYEKDSTNEVLSETLPGFSEVLLDALADNRWQVFFNQQDYEAALQATPYSIGFVDCANAADNSLKWLTYHEEEPTPANIAAGRYPFYKTLSYVYLKTLSPKARAFVDFTFSPAGQSILKDNHCLPLSRQGFS